MNCQRIRDLLPIYADGDPDGNLDAEDVEAISEHVQECAECQWRLSLDRQLASALSSLPEPSLPPDSVDTLRSRVVAQIARDRRWPSLRRATHTSANFLAAVVGLGMISFAILVLILAGAPFVDRGSGQILPPIATTRIARITPLHADSNRPRPILHPTLTSTPIRTSDVEVEPAALNVTQARSATVPARPPPGTHPEFVFFVDAAHDWVLDGDCSWPGPLDCSVLATTDGGSTWTEQFQTTLAIPDIFFVDANHGWLLESNCPGAAGWCPTAIFFTTNGGKTWAQRSATDHELSHLQFVNPDDGWAIGRRCPHSPDDCESTILKTTDGGRKWIDVTPEDFRPIDVSFADPFHGWAFGCSVRDRLPGGNCLNPLVLATSDGGKGWTAQLHLSTGFRQYGGRLDFVNRDEGWLLLSVTNQSNCAAENCWGTLYHTTDAGITWSVVQDWAHWDIRDLRQLDTRISVSGMPSDIRFVTSKFGWLTFNEEPDGSHGAIAVTSDGGKTWYRANVPETWRIGDLAATAASPTRAWIVVSQPEVGGSTRFLLEMDQMGRSWAQRLSLNPTTAVDFVDHDQR
jgi:photosystem II stability/assembly factor-like uncharacterized protein